MVVRDAAGCSVGIGDGSDIAASLVLEAAGARIQIGHRTHIGGGTLLDAAQEIVVGDDVLIAFGALIMDHDSHSLDFDHRRHDVGEWIKGRKDWTHVPRGAVHIDDKVWVGTRVIVLKGVHIGVGSVVAAGAVVTHDVPPWTLVAGCPARIVRELSKADSAVSSSSDE
ncbi:MAG TPA: acyltransferase [Acidothermaceae bacterium]|nr:acyltransferase [Acidothermaceae bacterium]